MKALAHAVESGTASPLRVLLVAGRRVTQGEAKLAESQAFQLSACDLNDARSQLEDGSYQAVLLDLSDETDARLKALEGWARDFPQKVWIVAGADPLAAERALRAGAHELLPGGIGEPLELARAIRLARARQDAVAGQGRSAEEEGNFFRTARMASLGMLAASVAHEINNPLAYAQSNLDFVAEEFESVEERLKSICRRFPNVAGGATGFPDLDGRMKEVRDAMDEAREGIGRVSEVVRSLKDFSSRPRADLHPVDLRHVADSTLRIAAHQIRMRAGLVKKLSAVPEVFGSEVHLGQVVLNLLVNAAQALPEGEVANHRVTLTTRTDSNGDAVLEVSDTGSGMSEEVARRIFEPFFTTKPPGEGTGLGLSVCKRVVESYGGSITVRSEEGVGTTFRVVLPAA